jgi:hypothetical protein
MSQSRCTLAIHVFNDNSDTVPSLFPPARPALQNVFPNKRRFSTVEDAAVAQRSPTKRQRTGSHTTEPFGDSRKLH